MSSFNVKIVKIEDVSQHPNADRLEIVKILGFDVVVGKGCFKKGDLTAYIPEASIVPDHIANTIGVKGKLYGKKKNRVKIIALRGVYSQGLLYPIEKNASDEYQISVFKDGVSKTKTVTLNEDVAEFMEIEKYRVEVPPMFQGEVFPIDVMERIRFDIENIKNYPDIIKDGEEVVFTEKIHGTFTHVVYLPPAYISREKINYPDAFQSDKGIVMVSSKQNSHNGFMFKKDGENNDRNAYLRSVRDQDLLNKLPLYFEEYQYPVILLAETFGPHIQDLNYGVLKGEQKGFRVFSVYTKEDGGMFKPMDSDELDLILQSLSLDRAPVLYRGPFSEEVMMQFTNGKETISGKEMHIREGIVISPMVERYNSSLNLGRVILKSINVDYLTRKGGTEFN